MAAISGSVTLGSGATQMSATSIPVRQLIVQNNASHNCNIGGPTVTGSRGILLASGPGGGVFGAGPFTAYNTNLEDWWLFGTNADVIDYVYLT